MAVMATGLMEPDCEWKWPEKRESDEIETEVAPGTEVGDEAIEATETTEATETEVPDLLEPATELWCPTCLALFPGKT